MEDVLEEEAYQCLNDLLFFQPLTRSREVDWDQARLAHGGYGPLQHFIGQNYQIILIEQEDFFGHYIARGQFEIAQEALKSGNKVWVWRDRREGAVRVRAVKKIGNDMQGKYGTVVI